MHSITDKTDIQKLTLEKIQAAVAQALTLARDTFGGRPISVAMCDAYGSLLTFIRMDDVPLRCISIAQQKAYTAVRMGSSTSAFAKRLVNEGLIARDFCDEGLTPLAGGQPITNAAGLIVAGIGISGLKPEEDDAIAAEIASTLLK